jgi:ATP-binding cassette, subfamily B, bacterial
MIRVTWQAQPLCFAGLMGVLVVQGSLPLASALLMKTLFDLLSQSIFLRATPVLTQWVVLLLVAQAALLVTSFLLSPLNLYFTAELGRRLSFQFRTCIYQKFSSFVGLSYFEDPQFQNSIQMASIGAQMSPLQSLAALTSLIQGTITVIAFLGVLVAFNPLLAVVVAGAALPHAYAQMRFGRQRFGVAFRNSPKERQADYYGQVLSIVTFAKEVRLFNLGEYFLKGFVQATRAIHSTQRAQQLREFRWQLPLALLAGAITSGAFVVVILQAFSRHLSLGDVVLYTSAVTSTQGSLVVLAMAASQINQSAMFYREYMTLLALPEALALPASPRPIPPLVTGITVTNVSFRYSEKHPWVLRHLNLFLPVGECLALVGLNGAGKTTLVKLLTRFYDPTEGQILWDGIDVREFDPQELRWHIGAILQDFARYELTAQQNIGLGNVGQIEQLPKVEQAARRAGIHDRLATFPQGYQSFLGRSLATEGVGIDLSGGEWQKIALSRMFMREAELLILDEPTASLDAQAEYELYAHFGTLMRGRTCLLITHRFSTVRMADSIVVIENGEVTEAGTHNELIAHNGTYATLYTMQAEQYQ